MKDFRDCDAPGADGPGEEDIPSSMAPHPADPPLYGVSSAHIRDPRVWAEVQLQARRPNHKTNLPRPKSCRRSLIDLKHMNRRPVLKMMELLRLFHAFCGPAAIGRPFLDLTGFILDSTETRHSHPHIATRHQHDRFPHWGSLTSRAPGAGLEVFAMREASRPAPSK